MRASRARIVEAGLTERRRVERDLHDGAQQRLLGVLLGLRLVRNQLDSGDYTAAGTTVDDARHELSTGLQEIRELAHGIHPAVLTDAGLPAALRSLAERAAVPVTITAVPTQRLPSAVEQTAYYVVAESLVNTVKHAHASAVSVCIRTQAGRLRVEIRDDGVGGAQPSHGSGLRGLSDRVAALDGHLSVSSTPGSGTTVIAELPVRLMLADDSVLFREGLASVLSAAGFEVLAQVGDADELMSRVKADPPDVAVLDVRMPPTHTTEGLLAAATIRRDHPQTGVLVLSQYVETHYALSLIEEAPRGAGYLLKDRVDDLDELVDAIRRIASGGLVIDPSVVAQLVGRRRIRDPLESLSERERAVLTCMAQGRSNSAISSVLFLSEKTVEAHIRNIFTRLDLPVTGEDNRRVLAVLRYLSAER